MADIVNGSLELNYNSFDFKNTDATGLSTHSDGVSYFQRYTLSFSTQPYPLVYFQAGGTFDKATTVTETNDVGSRATIIDMMPYASLAFSNPFVGGGASFSRRQERADSGAATQTEIQDTKRAYLTFRPQDLPSLDLQFTETNRYDRRRETENISTDDFAVTSTYAPVKGLSLLYTANLQKSKDKISETDTTTEAQNGRASYGTQFFKNILSFNTDYIRTSTTSEVSSGHGALKLPLFPFAGLSTISVFNSAPPPSIVSVTLSPNQPLIDGNLTASTGLNIGQSVSQGADTRFREMGLDFSVATSVNTLDVSVVLNQAAQDLPAVVADNFTWYIYTSPDNLNWTLFQAGLKAAFDPFSNRFEISFPAVTTRYIMAAVQPLSIGVIAPPGVDVSNIFITEFQAFQTTLSTLSGSKTSASTEFYDMSLRANLLKSPNLVYNVNYTHVKTDPGGTTFTLDNSLSLSDQLSRVLRGSARVGRSDSGGTSAPSTLQYYFNAALYANPLPTLNHTFALSGNRSETLGVTSNTLSMFLNNYAHLYQGIDVYLSGGESRTSTSLETDNENTAMNAGASLTPHKNLTISANYVASTTRQSSQGVERPPNRTYNTNGSAAYRPVQTVYFVYSIGEVSGTHIPRQTFQSFSATWSPLSSGTLQVFWSYNENIQSGVSESFTRVKSAGVTWAVGPRINWSASYIVTKSEVVSQMTSESKSISTDITMSF